MIDISFRITTLIATVKTVINLFFFLKKEFYKRYFCSLLSLFLILYPYIIVQR